MMYMRKQTFWLRKILAVCGSEDQSVPVHLCGFFCLGIQKVFSCVSSASTICAEILPLLLWKVLVNAEVPPIPIRNSATSQDPQIPNSAFILPLSAKTEENHLGNKGEWNNDSNWFITGTIKFSTNANIRKTPSIICHLVLSTLPMSSVFSQWHASKFPASLNHPIPVSIFLLPTCSLI